MEFGHETRKIRPVSNISRCENWILSLLIVMPELDFVMLRASMFLV